MLIIYNNGFQTSDSYGNMEPKVSIGPVNIISTGCEVLNKNILVPFNKIDKSSFSGVGSVSPNSVKDFQINLSCDPVSPIKITFTGTPVNNSMTPGTIALNNPTDVNTAKGYGIQVKYKNDPIKINQMMTIEEKMYRRKIIVFHYKQRIFKLRMIHKLAKLMERYSLICNIIDSQKNRTD